MRSRNRPCPAYGSIRLARSRTRNANSGVVKQRVGNVGIVNSEALVDVRDPLRRPALVREPLGELRRDVRVGLFPSYAPIFSDGLR